VQISAQIFAPVPSTPLLLGKNLGTNWIVDLVGPRSGLGILETINMSNAHIGICTLDCQANSMVAIPTALLRLPQYTVELLYSGSRCSRSHDNLAFEGNNHGSGNFGSDNFQYTLLWFYISCSLEFIEPINLLQWLQKSKKTTEGMAGKRNSLTIPHNFKRFIIMHWWFITQNMTNNCV